MKTALATFLVMVLFITGHLYSNNRFGNGSARKQQPDRLTLMDSTRKRLIPIAVYPPSKKDPSQKPALVIFSHGYGQNKGGDYLTYSYLTEFLASKGFFVVSIQHELPGDSLIPVTGIPQVVRRPFWERGADNILFVIQSLKRSHPELDFGNIILIGHSNGGDMTALFPQKYPGIAATIITLDNRRMPLPQIPSLRVMTLRSSDQPADEGVLPTNDQLQVLNMRIIPLSDIRHNDMNDSGSKRQHKTIQKLVWKFLQQ